MEIRLKPALSDDDAETLEGVLSDIASELEIDGADVAGCVDGEGEVPIGSLEIFYEDRDDDAAPAGLAKDILAEFDRVQSEGLDPELKKIVARVGRIELRI